MVAETGVFQRDGVDLPYSRTGAGPPHYVLVHGIGMEHRSFAGVAERLSTTGTVHAVDLPGFGDSPEPQSAHTVPQQADLLAAYLRSRPLSEVILVGHSMGTQVTAELAASHPDLVHGLVLIAPTVNQAERRRSTQLLRFAQDLWGESPRVLLTGLTQYARVRPRWLLRQFDTMLDHRVEDLCERLRMPTLIIRGENDRVCPYKWATALADRLPDATLQQIPDRGHEAIIKDPEPATSMIIDFAGMITERR